MTIEEVLAFVRSITRATGLPLMVDGDTGYGEALNVMRLVRDFEDAGAAPAQLEEQILPKKCGHLSDNCLFEPEVMAAKIAAAVKSRRRLRIIGPTDAIASEGLDAAILRAQLYLAAGADMIFPEVLIDAEDMARFRVAMTAAMLANMTELVKPPGSQRHSSKTLVLIWSFGRYRPCGRPVSGLIHYISSCQ